MSELSDTPASEAATRTPSIGKTASRVINRGTAASQPNKNPPFGSYPATRETPAAIRASISAIT